MLGCDQPADIKQSTSIDPTLLLQTKVLSHRIFANAQQLRGGFKLQWDALGQFLLQVSLHQLRKHLLCLVTWQWGLRW